MYGKRIRMILKNNHPKASKASFTPSVDSNELEKKFRDIAEIEGRIKEIEDCIPDLKI